MSNKKLSKKETLEVIYTVIVNGYDKIFNKLLDESYKYSIKSHMSEKKDDPFTYFTITETKNPKNIIDTKGLLLGFHEAGSDMFTVNTLISGIIKDKFIELAKVLDFNKDITNIISDLFNKNIIEIENKFIQILPYLISIIYLPSNNNVIRFQTDMHGKLLCTYFLIFDFPLKITKKDITDVDTTLSLLNIASSSFTFERSKGAKKNIKNNSKYKSLSKYIKSKNIKKNTNKK